MSLDHHTNKRHSQDHHTDKHHSHDHYTDVDVDVDILSTSYCLGLGDGWGMKPSLGRPEVNKCKMQNSIANLNWYFCYVVASNITLFTSTHVSDVEARRIGIPPASDS